MFYFRLVAYELLYEGPSNHRERMKVIISSQFLYFFGDSPPDPKTLDSKIPLDELAECRPAKGKASKIILLCLEQSTHLYMHFLLISLAIPPYITFWKYFVFYVRINDWVLVVVFVYNCWHFVGWYVIAGKLKSLLVLVTNYLLKGQAWMGCFTALTCTHSHRYSHHIHCALID